jgi:hypothetical protein
VNAVAGCFVIELDRSEEVPVIGHSNGRHLLMLRNSHELFNIAGAIQEGVIGMAVEVNERTFGHAFQS